jgi:regulator of nucleoside diphosphate kinase
MRYPASIFLSTSDARALSALIERASGGRDAEGAARLAEELARATIVPEAELPAQTVTLDSWVRFLNQSSGRVREVTLVLPSVAEVGAGRISVLSPIGSALIGLRVGDGIDWPLPSGQMTRLRVLHVERAPARALLGAS